MDRNKYKTIALKFKTPSFCSYRMCKRKIIRKKKVNLYENTLSLFFAKNMNSKNIAKIAVILNDKRSNEIKKLVPRVLMLFYWLFFDARIYYHLLYLGFLGCHSTSQKIRKSFAYYCK